jgi:cytochrome c oxidase subunit 2
MDDVEGQRMRPMSRTVDDELEARAVSMYIAGLPAHPPAATVQGDAAKGAQLYATCAACHGPDGKGNEQLGAPTLLVQPDWYLARQLGKFKAGVRGAHPKDVRGAQMRPMAMTLADDQAVNDVIAHVNTLRK